MNPSNDKGHLSVKEVDQFVTLLARLATVEMERDAMREALEYVLANSGERSIREKARALLSPSSEAGKGE